MQERQIRLLEMLHKNQGYMTAQTLAKAAGCSLQTVRNDIRYLREMLETGGLGTIHSKSNKGFLLEETEDWDYIRKILKKNSGTEIYAEENLYKICEILLKKSKVQMNQLENLILMGRSGVEKYTEFAGVWMEKHGIALERKRGKGLAIRCDEYTWRLAMLSLFSEIPKNRNELGKVSLTARIEAFLWGFDTRGVRDGIAELEDAFGFHFSFDAYQQLLFLVSLSVSRSRAKIAVNQSDKMEYEGMEYDRKLVAWIIPLLERYYGYQIPEEEYDFLLFAVSISEIQDFHNLEEREIYEQDNAHIGSMVERIIRTTEDILRLDFSEDRILRDSLFHYLKAIILRLRFHLENQNPFLNQIKSRYPNLYAAAWSAGLILETETGQALGENEVAYLALYFGGAVERLNGNISVYILCNYGIGVSQIIREQIEKSIPNLTVLDVVTTRDPFKIQRKQCDFLISTVPIGESFVGKDVLEIGNMLQPRDVRRIQEKIRQVRKSRMQRIAVERSEPEKSLFHENLVFQFDGNVSKEILLRTMCDGLIAQGYAKAQLTETVLKREQVTSTVLSSKVAIPHGMADCVLEPAIAVGMLKAPICWDGENQVDRIFLLSLNLEEKFHARAQVIRFYSALVELLEDEEEYQAFWKLSERNAVSAYLNEWVRQRRKPHRT